MKKFKRQVFACLVATLMCCVFGLTGCFGGGNNNNSNEPPTPQEYTIQYSDESGTKQITVTQGQPYSLAAIPEKTGYTFLGLYDAEVGGTQYVTATGSSVSPYTDGKSIVLYPQYKAKEYTVILDYQGATVTGSRQLKVDYGNDLPELPKNLTLEHKDFTGWYTQENGKGVQVADKYGLLPKVSVVNENNFELTSDGYLYLYAGFDTEKFNVTCYFEAGVDEEVVKVEWNTPVSKIVPKTRKNGEAPLTWSKKSDRSELFNGNITDDTVLYAVEYAPVIELDTDGGDEINPVIARAGATISLPTPTKENYKFVKWETLDGETADYSTMPSKSVSLKALWQAKIVFDSNGGSAVNDISVAAGNSIILPTPEKEDFIFAGWYTEDKELYTRSTMPSASVKLKAGWYKAKEKTITIIQQFNPGNNIDCRYSSINSNASKKIYVSDLLSGNDSIRIEGKLHYTFYNDNETTAYVALYQTSTITSNNKIIENATHINRASSASEVLKFSAIISDDLWLYYWGLQAGTYYTDIYDVFIELKYPDTANLYL